MAITICTNMIKRNIEDELLKLANEFPVVAVLGPRQSGKTTIVKHTFSTYKYVSMEDSDSRTFASEDPRGFFKKYDKNVIIDEIQRIPELLSYIQTITDNMNEEGIFIITGSHNYLLMEKVTQSLAGRVGISTLLPLSYNELLNDNEKITLFDLLYKGGYPRLYDKKIRTSTYYNSYLHTYIERDIRLIKNISDYDLFIKFIRLLAGRTGQIVNTVSLGDDCGISHNTVKEWISLLETSYIIFKLQPFYKNYNKRLIKSPKIYFYDTGLVSFLLGIKDSDEILTNYMYGNIFETFIISNLIKFNYNHGKFINFYYWRDNHRNEVDLIIEDGDIFKVVEIKGGSTFNKDMLKGINYMQKIPKQDFHNFSLIYSGEDDFTYNSVNITSWKNSNYLL